MPGSVAERISALRAVRRRDPYTRRVPLRDVLSCSLSWYGFARSRLLRSASVEPAGDGLVWVDLGDYGLAWPAAARLEQLATALVETRVPSNPHYYFRAPTPVRTGDHVLDVGACEGAFALESLVRWGAAHAWCFEPSPAMAAALRLTAQRTGHTGRLTVVEAAVSSTAGTSTLIEDPGNPLIGRVGAPSDDGGSVGSVAVSQVALDDWAAEAGIARVDYLKIDAEGSDVRVLEGARGLLREFRPRIAVTTYHQRDHCDAMIELLGALDVGYAWSVRGLVVHDGTPRPVMLHAAPR